MPPDARDSALLWDMLQAARQVQAFVRGKALDAFLSDQLLQAGVERKIEIIGEAARKVSEGFKRDAPDIPWRAIMGQRHVLAHDYGEIRQDSMWRVATERVPELIAALEPLVPEPPPLGQ